MAPSTFCKRTSGHRRTGRVLIWILLTVAGLALLAGAVYWFGFRQEDNNSGSSNHDRPAWPQSIEKIHAVGDARLRHWDMIAGIAVSPQGDQIVSIGDDCRILVWNTASGEVVQELPDEVRHADKFKNFVNVAAVFSGDGTKLTTCINQVFKQRAWPSLEPIAEAKIGQPATRLISSDNGEMLMVEYDDLSAELWKREGDKLTRDFRKSGRSMKTGLSPDGSLVADSWESISASDLGTGARLWNVDERGDHPTFSADSKQLAVRVDESVHVFDARTGELISKMYMPGVHYTMQFYDSCISSDLNHLATVQGDDLHLWDLRNKKHYPPFRMSIWYQTHRVGGGSIGGNCQFSANGGLLAATRNSGEIKAWRLPGGDAASAGQAEREFFIRAVQFSEDSSQLIAFGENGEVSFTRADDGKESQRLRAEHPGLPVANTNATRLIGRVENGLGALSAQTGETLPQIPVEGELFSYAVSPDGNSVAYTWRDVDGVKLTVVPISQPGASVTLKTKAKGYESLPGPRESIWAKSYSISRSKRESKDMFQKMNGGCPMLCSLFCR